MQFDAQHVDAQHVDAQHVDARHVAPGDLSPGCDVLVAQTPRLHSWRWWVTDALVTLGVALLGIPALLEGGDRSVAAAIPALLLLTLPLLFRRRQPRTVFYGLLAVAAAIVTAGDIRLGVNFSIVVALYTVASISTRRSAVIAAGIVELLAIVAIVRLALTDWWVAAVFATGMILAALGLGLYSATRQAYLRELHDRAERLERERDQLDELAVAAERARITREMHDILAHHLTVMVALSDGAASTSVASPARAAEVMRTVSATGRLALADTRRLLAGPTDGRGSTGDRQPVPDLTGLDDLIARVRSAGLPVSYEVRGTINDLAPGLQLTIYRLVQEALTNTLKHAGTGAGAVVRLRRLADTIHLDVEDNGAGARAVTPATAGRGVAGMRERVHSFGGEFRSGPGVPAGWLVSARLPTGDEVRV